MAFVAPLITKPTHSLSNFRPATFSTCCTSPQKRTRQSHLSMTLDVLVTGAAGKTGRLVFQLLNSAPDKFSVTGLVRDRAKALQLDELNDGNLIEGDISVPETLVPAMKGKDALIVLTSAIPLLQGPPSESQPPVYYFEAGGMPEDIDWVGARSQIDLAKSLEVKHVVFVGSMGSTDDNHRLNKLGNGNILKFKRKAENYLIESGVPYTIINPAGLINEPPNERELIIGHSDKLFEVYEQRECSIPRGDVARVVVSALTTPAAKNKALDLIGQPVGRGEVTKDPSGLFEEAHATL